jgi:hypothetical protein
LFNSINATCLSLVCLGGGMFYGSFANAQDSISFTNDVAPVIVAKCGGCHVSNAKGNYGIGSYAALMKTGSIAANNPEGSHFIEVIESGEMPKGKLAVTDGELKTLTNWIAQGATFDGDSKDKPLVQSGADDVRQTAGRGGVGGRQRSDGSRLHAVERNPQAVGDEGVAWYVTWKTGLAEAKRSNRPIFFMSAAAQCSGVSGVF